MDEHPGDTLGNRFLTFWGALGAIAAVALLLGLYRWVAIPSSTAATDGGVSDARRATLSSVLEATNTEFNQVAEVEAGKTVRLPANTLIAYSAKTLAAQKPAPGPIKTPEGQQKEAEEKAKTSHDPNLSKFEGK